MARRTASRTLRFNLPGSLTPAAVRRELHRLGDIRSHPPLTIKRVFHDTFDWRLYNRGTALEETLDADGVCTLWKEVETVRTLGRTDRRAPAFARDLPEGSLREGLEPVIEMRRLLPVASLTTTGRLLELLDDNRKVVARIALEEHRIDRGGKGGRRVLREVRISPLRGFERESRKVRAFLKEDLGLPPAEVSLLAAAAEAAGRTPGGYPPKPDLKLDPSQPAEEAVRTILASLLDTMEANLEGTLKDLDTEFLHDFRVSVRRTRSALSQIKGVLPPSVVRRYRPGFAWLGQVTGPSRDIHVYLLTFPEYRDSLPEFARDDLLPLRDFLKERRKVEHRAMSRALRSKRFRELVEDWRDFVEKGAPEEDPGPHAGEPILAVAGGRIRKTFRRAVRDGEAIDDGSPAEMLHELRKTCKKLRYLLEFFRSLFPAGTMGRLIGDLKGLQDNLGEFQDLHVQSETLRRFASMMQEETEARADTILAVGMLVENLRRRQAEVRREFRKRFSDFATPGNRRFFKALSS